VNVKKTVVGANPFEAFKAVIAPLLAAAKTPLASANQRAAPRGAPN
jgi:hypothetical protein